MTGSYYNGYPVTFSGSSDTIDAIADGVHLARDNSGEFYNAATDANAASANYTTAHMKWSTGWEPYDDFDVRSWSDSFGQLFGEGSQDPETLTRAPIVMWDTLNNKYHKFDITEYAPYDLGAYYRYTRQEVLPNQSVGITFSDGSKLTSNRSDDPIINDVYDNENENRYIVAQKADYVQGSFGRRRVGPLKVTALAGSGDNKIVFVTTNQAVSMAWQYAAAQPTLELEIAHQNGQNYQYDIPGTDFAAGDTDGEFTIEWPAGGNPYTFEPDTNYELTWYVKNDEPTVWFNPYKYEIADYYRGAVIHFHAYIENKGTVVGTIHTTCDDGTKSLQTFQFNGSNSQDWDTTLSFIEATSDRLCIKLVDTNDETVPINFKIQYNATMFFGDETYD